MTRITRQISSAILAFIMMGCGGSVDDGSSPDASTPDASTTTDTTTDNTVGTTADPCGCTVFEDHPSASAIYIKTCGNRAQYVELSTGGPNEISVCVYVTDAG
jgi:hypothetical protein